MTKKDYQLIAEALKVAGETDITINGGTEPGTVWWVTVNELITRFKADNPRFNETIFRAAVEPRVSLVIAVPGGTGTRPILPGDWRSEIGSREYDQGGEAIWEGGTYS